MVGRHWKALAMASLAAMTISACAGEEGAEDTMGDAGTDTVATAPQPAGGQVAADLPEGVTQEQFDQGRQLFTGQAGCVACHGPQAEGTQLAPDLTDSEWLNVSGRNFDEIVQLIKSGVPQPEEHPGPMPPMGGANLTDDQVNALAAYVVGISQG